MDKKREKIMVLVLVVAIVSLSLAVGYSFYSNNTKFYNYTGFRGEVFSFAKSPQGDHYLNWTTKSQITGNVFQLYDFVTPFPYGPEDLEDIPIEFSLTRVRIKNSPSLYLTRDVYLDKEYHPEFNSKINKKGGMVIALLGFQRVAEKYGISPMFASIEDNERTKELNLPVINCGSANEFRRVIWFKEGNETKIYRDSENENYHCFIAQFKKGEDPARVGTALAYHLIGVFE